MPQIGWFEILIIVIVAILVIGPKEFPYVLRKLGSFIGSTKRYFSDLQNKISKFDESTNKDIIPEKKVSNKTKDDKNG